MKSWRMQRVSYFVLLVVSLASCSPILDESNALDCGKKAEGNNNTVVWPWLAANFRSSAAGFQFLPEESRTNRQYVKTGFLSYLRSSAFSYPEHAEWRKLSTTLSNEQQKRSTFFNLRYPRAIKVRKTNETSSGSCITSNKKSEEEDEVVSDTLEHKINKTLNYFTTGEHELELSRNKSIIVIIGVSGSGKSTLLQFLTTDNKHLIADKICGQMIINDGNNRIGSTTKSHTKIPEKHVGTDGIIFYDMPGFGDTRNPIYDITTAYFIKNVLDHAKEVKIILTVGHGKVKVGADRKGFKTLLENVVQLVPNIDKFKNGFGLVITKIDRFETDGIESNDVDIINNVASFLEILQNDTISDKDPNKNISNQAIIKLIDILNFQDEERDYEFINIGLFQRPFVVGPLNEDVKLQKSKKKLDDIIKVNVKYVPSNREDFHLTISSDSQIYIRDLSASIDKYVTNDLNNIFSYALVIILDSKNNSLDETYILNESNTLSQFEPNLDEKILTPDLDFIIKVRNALQIINVNHLDENFNTMFSYLKFSNILTKYLPEKVETNFESWKQLYVKNITEILDQMNTEDLNFILKCTISLIKSETLSCGDFSLKGHKISTSEVHWENASLAMNFILQLKSALKIININIDNKFAIMYNNAKLSNTLTQIIGEKTDDNKFKVITQLVVKSLTENVEVYVDKNLDELTEFIITSIFKYNDKNKLKFNLMKNLNTENLSKITSVLNNIVEKSLSTSDFIITVRKMLKSINVNIDKKFGTLYNYFKLLDNFSELTREKQTTIIKQWTVKFEKVKLLLTNLISWNEFLSGLHCVYYTQYEIQKAKLQSNIKTAIQCSESQISDNSTSKLPEYLNTLIGEYKYRGFTSYNNIIPIHKNFDDIFCLQLNAILDSTMHNKPVTVLETDVSLILENDFIILSDITTILSHYSSKQNIFIFAYIKIYIDTNIVFENSRNVKIFSPTWEIIEKVEIKLIGTHGNSYSSRARDGVQDTGQYGTDGMSGSSGYPAGDFIAIGNVIINANLLTITSLGGNGGSGQHGGNGGHGIPGERSTKQYFINQGARKSGNEFRLGAYRSNLDDDHMICDAYPYRDDKIIAVLINSFKYSFHCNLKGTIGWSGGNGGRGGNYGYEGEPGRIDLHFNNDQSNIVVQKLKGNRGQPGLGGSLGFGGGTYHHYVKEVKEEVYPIYTKQYWYICAFDNFVFKYDNPNKNGISGINGNILPAILVNPTKLAENINYFRNSGYNNLKSVVLKEDLYKLLTSEMVPHDQIGTSYLLSDYVTEYKLFLQNYEYINQHFIPNIYLKHLFDRVSNIHNKLSTENDKLLFDFLTNAIIIKSNVETNSEKSIIINIKQYINQIIERIKNFKDLEKVSYLNSIKNEFQAEINMQINKATSLASNHLEKNIELYRTQVNVNIQSLLNEVFNLQNQLKDYKADLKKIESAMKLEQSLNILKTIGNVVSVLGPLYSDNVNLGLNVLKVGVQTGLDIASIEKTNDKNFVYTDLGKAQNVIQTSIASLSSNTNTREAYKQALVSTFNAKYKPSVDKLTEVKQTIEKVDKAIENSIQFEIDIKQQLEPFLLKISSDLSQIDKELKNTSQVEIILQKWEMKANLRKMQNIISEVTNGLKVDAKFSSMINELNLAIEIVYDIHEKIDNFNAQKKSYDFFTKMALPSDALLRNEQLSSLNHDIESNIIIQQYNKLLSVVKQHVFPFAANFTEFDNIQFQNASLYTDKANIASKRVKEIQDKILYDELGIGKNDENIFYDNFYSKYPRSRPFYIWKSDEYNNEISQLLTGNEITFYSNVYADNVKNALKFTDLNLIFSTHNKSKQNSLDEIMEHLSVNLVHSGINYYKCNDRYFMIESKNVSLTLSFARDSNNKPIQKSKSFDKLGKGDMLLSPYTYWTVQLIDENNSNKFEDLKQFEDGINIELSGYGEYLKENHPICNLDLNQFYTEHDESDFHFEYYMYN